MLSHFRRPGRTRACAVCLRRAKPGCGDLTSNGRFWPHRRRPCSPAGRTAGSRSLRRGSAQHFQRNSTEWSPCSILEGDTFVVSDRRGDIDASPDEPHGLFHQDTRFLSRWQLTVDGGSPACLSTDDVHYFAAQFFLVAAGRHRLRRGPVLADPHRARSGDGFHEDLTVHQPRRPSRSTSSCASRPPPTSPTCSRSRTRSRRRASTTAGRRRPARARLSAGAASSARPGSPRARTKRELDEHGLRFRIHARAPRRMDDVPRRRHRRPRVRPERGAAPSTATATRGRGRTCASASRSGSQAAPRARLRTAARSS